MATRLIMRRSRWAILMLCILTLVGMATGAAGADVPDVVATVEGKPIAMTELTTALKGELLRLDMQRYQAMKNGLDNLIAERLMQLEASKRQISVEQLVQQEIETKVPTVTPEQVKTFYEANKNRIRQPLDKITPRIEAYLQQQEQEKRERTFVHELRQRYKVTVALHPPTIDVSSDDDPFMGPADASVTIIEFSDFQCPYCRRVQPALKKLMKEYEGRVKLVFRDFPLRRIHPQAQKAAEAAQCAADQNKFWPYHDKLFATSALFPHDLKNYAKELGLDTKQFDACLDSNKHAQEVEKDLKDGEKAGVSATPSFFVNGQPLSGAASYERFQELVEAALANNQQ